MTNLFYIRDNVPIRVQIGEEIKTLSKNELLEIIEKENLSVSSCGILYKKNKQGVLPAILTEWYKLRKETKNKSLQYKKDGDKEKAEYHDRIQYSLKIMLNSAYGAIGTSLFRYYDKDNASSVTLSGQQVIKTVMRHFNDIYNREMGNIDNNKGDYVIAADTDSNYINFKPLLDKYNFTTFDDCKNFCINKTLEYEISVNKFFDIFCDRIFNVQEHTIKMSAEKLCSTGLWTDAKKRYALLKVYDFEVQKDVFNDNKEIGKLTVTGFDVVRSSFPVKFKDFMGKLLEMIVRKVDKKIIDQDILDFEAQLVHFNVHDIAKTSSVKFLSQKEDKNYNPPSRKSFEIMLGSPAQVKASLYYNDLLTHFKLTKKYDKIYHSMKVKWVYMKNNSFGIDCLAFKGDNTDPKEIMDVLNTYVDKKKMYEMELKNKLEEIFGFLKWDYPNVSYKKAAGFFNF